MNLSQEKRTLPTRLPCLIATFAAGLTVGLGLPDQPAHAALVVGVDYAQATQDLFPGTTAETVGSNNVGSASLITSNIGDPTGGSAVVDVTVTEIGDDDDLEARGGNGANNRTDLDPGVYPLADLAEDIINARGGEMAITISGLPAGEFTFLGVFNDSFTTNNGFASEAEFDILLTDAANTAAFQDNVLASNVDNNTIANSSDQTIASSTFTITSNGTDDVLIELVSTGVGADNSGFDGFIPLSGFTVNVIPVPPAVALGAVGLIGLMAKRTRRNGWREGCEPNA